MDEAENNGVERVRGNVHPEQVFDLVGVVFAVSVARVQGKKHRVRVGKAGTILRGALGPPVSL